MLKGIFSKKVGGLHIDGGEVNIEGTAIGGQRWPPMLGGGTTTKQAKDKAGRTAPMSLCRRYLGTT